jgi:prevent-host-death family protein
MERIHSLSEAKARLSAIIDEIEKGDEVVITRMGRPVARVVPYKPAEMASRLGFASGEIRLAEDFDQWSEEEARALGIVD